MAGKIIRVYAHALSYVYINRMLKMNNLYNLNLLTGCGRNGGDVSFVAK